MPCYISNTKKAKSHSTFFNNRLITIKMKHEHHKNASEHYEKASKHHKEADREMNEGNEEKASHHAQVAQGHSAKGKEEADNAAKKNAERNSK